MIYVIIILYMQLLHNCNQIFNYFNGGMFKVTALYTSGPNLNHSRVNTFKNRQKNIIFDTNK